jgi:hypothetical protein
MNIVVGRESGIREAIVSPGSATVFVRTGGSATTAARSSDRAWPA